MFCAATVDVLKSLDVSRSLLADSRDPWSKKTKCHTVKPVLSGHSKRIPSLILKTEYRLMQIKSIAECSKGSIMQYF